MTDRKKVILAEAALLLCGIVWGGSFSVMKNTLDTISVNWLLCIRYFFGAVAVFILFGRRMLHADKRTLIGGLLSGVLIYLGSVVQTVGLTTTTAGNNAFITAIYVVLVPFMQWAVIKKRPGLRAVIAAAVCLTGVGVIALDTQLTISAGDAWTLLSGVLYAVNIVLVAQYLAAGADALALTCFHLFIASVCALFAALLFEPLPALEVIFAPATVVSLLYLILLSTAFALCAQNIALRYAPAAHASLLMGTEAPFGCLFGILLLGEPFTLRFALGALLIAGSIVYSELGKKHIKATVEAAISPENQTPA